MTTTLRSWSIRAVNLAEHADNPVHTVEGGLAAGYAGAVVAGTTIYAYLTRPAVTGWGTDWLARGTAEVRFHAPVLADEPIDLVPTSTDEGWVIEARGDGGLRATCAVGRSGADSDEPTGDRLEPMVVVLDDRWSGYAARAGENLPMYREQDLVHPVVWPSLANRVFATQLVNGAWVHTRSVIRHLGLARPGETAVVESWVTDRFSTRAGERAVVDVRISVDDRPIAAIEHEALVSLG